MYFWKNLRYQIMKTKIYIIDNDDSFTYNLVHYVEQFADIVKVVRNKEIDIKEISKFDKIIISPGPGLPKERSILFDILDTYHKTKPILGVCLGMQTICEYFGGKLYNLKHILHGVPSNTIISNYDYIYQNIPKSFTSGRYHSWAIENNSLPSPLKITSKDENNVIMSISHNSLDIKGVQYHPESIMTEYGLEIIKNWIQH